MLPLDLHVLGLSLAFILSQDQTLRSIFFPVLLTCPRFLILTVTLSPRLAAFLFVSSSLSKIALLRVYPFGGTPSVFGGCKGHAFF